MDAPAQSRVTADGRAVFAPLGNGEGVIVDTKEAFYFSLNRTAAFLWERLAATPGASAPELAAALCERFDVSTSDAQADVARFVERVRQLGLVSSVG